MVILCIASIQKLASQYPNWNVESYGDALKMCEEMTKEADPNTQVIPTMINNEVTNIQVYFFQAF